jgi:hypothetical protein
MHQFDALRFTHSQEANHLNIDERHLFQIKDDSCCVTAHLPA